jgi:hypothetical protein
LVTGVEEVMISNERRFPQGSRARSGPPRRHHHPKSQYPSFSTDQSKQGIPEETLKTSKVQIERKTFVFTLKENPRGRFLRITEDVHGTRDSIIVPASGLVEFRKNLEEIIEASGEVPPPIDA